MPPGTEPGRPPRDVVRSRVTAGMRTAGGVAEVTAEAVASATPVVPRRHEGA
ncbi:hypothetical protein AB0K58_23790 [Streptomyces sp. NPDC053808]|uniref:hypothetical protein n=1 Tax=Streptomyces sp. NPDC053808 TaxID=3156679 RepID=UPI003421F2D7